MGEGQQNSQSEVSWTDLVDKIRRGEPAGMERLYRVFSRGIRFHLCRHLGPEELDDRLHDAFLSVVQAIQRGELREPERLMGFVRTLVRRQVAGYIDQAVRVRRDFTDLELTPSISDQCKNPEERMIAGEREKIMIRVMKSNSPRDREILTRFYLLEQSQEQICAEMSLTETQFRNLKSRAKARFSEVGKKRFLKRPCPLLVVRAPIGSQH